MYFHSHLRSTNFNVIMSMMALWTSSKIVKFTAHEGWGGVYHIPHVFIEIISHVTYCFR